MCARKLRLNLSEPAQRDVEDILLYTPVTFGPDQAEVYQEDIDALMVRLQRFPYLGMERPELGQGSRVAPVGAHVVLYMRTNDAVHLLRILHQSQDVRPEDLTAP